jgi:hypothetical protein
MAGGRKTVGALDARRSWTARSLGSSPRDTGVGGRVLNGRARLWQAHYEGVPELVSENPNSRGYSGSPVSTRIRTL